MSYLDLCEALWRAWVRGEARLSPELGTLFDLDAAPEPYLSFDAGPEPLVVLTTNPGAPMPHQRRSAIRSGRSPASSEMGYSAVARAMADYYRRHLTGAAARRIRGQLELASAAGYDGVLQVECCPWHSPRLPNKGRLVRSLTADQQLSRYVEALKRYLSHRPVLAISAVSSRRPLNPEAGLSPWLQWQRALMGLEPTDFIPLVRKGSSITSAALVDARRTPKALVLMMGGNHLPSIENCKPLIDAIRRGETPETSAG